MKQSMGFKAIVPLIAVGFSLAAYEVNAAGIPVYCANCQEASHAAGNAVVDAIRGQTEALVAGMNYVMRTESAVEDERELTRQKTEIDKNYEPSLGAKPRAACSQMGGAVLRGAAASSSATMKKAIRKSVAAHNKRSASLAPGESSQDYDMKKIFEVMDADPDEFDGGEIVLARMPIEPGDAADELEKVKMLMNPYPVALPPAEEIARIKSMGTPEEKKKLSESVVLNERQSVFMRVVTDNFERDIKKLEKDKLATMLADIEPYLDAEQKKQLEGNLSENQLEELLATYRVRSPEWIANAATAEQTPAIRDIMLTNAEILSQLWKLNRNIENLAAANAISQSRELSRDGLLSR